MATSRCFGSFYSEDSYFSGIKLDADVCESVLVLHQGHGRSGAFPDHHHCLLQRSHGGFPAVLRFLWPLCSNLRLHPSVWPHGLQKWWRCALNVTGFLHQPQSLSTAELDFLFICHVNFIMFCVFPHRASCLSTTSQTRSLLITLRTG